MNLLIPFVLSAIYPGLGQLYTAKYWKGLAFIISPIIAFFLFPLGLIFSYTILIIISLTDLYLSFEKKENKKRVLNNLIFAILIVIIVIPSIFYLFTISMYEGGLYVKDEFLSENYTKSEMDDIMKALNKYQSDTDTFPSDYVRFVKTKPIWDSWYSDDWGNSYKYINEGGDIKLISAGKDATFGTEDDIILTSSAK